MMPPQIIGQSRYTSDERNNPDERGMNSGVPLRVTGNPVASAPGSSSSASARAPGLWGWFRAHRPALILVGLSILIPELLTGSTPVASLLNPLGDLFLLGLYGGGVLVIREVALRWNRGWAPVLLLGAAYGVVEEGLGTRTFFDWVEIGRPNFGPYSHWAGVNWVWAGELTVFHSVFSIALPIALVGLLYPASRTQPFLSTRAIGWTFGAYLLTATLMFFLYDRPFVLALALVAGCLVAIGLLVLAAWKVPREWLQPRTGLPRISPRNALLLGAIFVWGFFLIFWGTPGPLKDPFLTVALGWAFSAVMLWALRASIGRSGNEAQVAYFSIGLLTFLLADAVLEEILGDLFVFLAVALALLLIFRVHRAYRSGTAPTEVPSGVTAG
jgi:hypothetical protein